ncbi:hypothetical protein [uncultured Oscillibacter sp.]|uniref:hypothetical protein n=1 Tax=uncultured Oscillibacter sp. TaxID=876091 RepID=UPI0025EE4DA6|nr:hypothetical protein [uncultured Oscillibacter sp.]
MIKQMRKRILVAILIIIPLLFLGWRLRPHSLYDIFQIEQGSVSSLSISVSEPGVKNGNTFINQYLLNAVPPHSNDFSAIMSILEDSQYRSDLRNLLPWDIDRVNSGSRNISYSAIITLCWSNPKASYGGLYFLNDKKIAVSLDAKNGYLILHPTNRNTLENLATYLIGHGERS